MPMHQQHQTAMPHPVGIAEVQAHPRQLRKSYQSDFHANSASAMTYLSRSNVKPSATFDLQSANLQPHIKQRRNTGAPWGMWILLLSAFGPMPSFAGRWKLSTNI
jgi:hypothetical protein